MIKGSKAIVLSGMAISLALGGYALGQAAPAVIGVASAVVKEAKLSNAQVTRPRPIALRQRIALGDLVQTGKASRLQILLLDRSTFTVGPNASLRIDRFVYDPARGRAMGSTMVRGAFRFMSGRPNSQNTSTINSPVATIGIRGTILEGIVGEGARTIAKDEVRPVREARADPDSATLVVLRGPGSRTEAGAQVGAASVTSGGVTIDLTEPMQAAFVPRAGAVPIGPFRISPGGLAQLQDRVYPDPTAKAGSGGSSLLGGLLQVLPVATGVIGGSGGNGGRGGQRGTNTGTTTQYPTNYPTPGVQ